VLLTAAIGEFQPLFILVRASAGVCPAGGPGGGGQTVTIAGTNLSGATSVTFGGNSASITSDSATQIVVATPAHAAGAFDVIVTTPDGAANAPSAYEFIAEQSPTIFSITPNRSSPAGGETVVISGY